MEFGPEGWNLGLGARILASRQGIGQQGLELGFKAEIRALHKTQKQLSSCIIIFTTTSKIGLKSILNKICNKARPDTWLPKSSAGGQGPYLRSLDHFGVKEIKS